MHRHTIRTAGRILDPRLNDEPFAGTYDEALAAIVTYAAEMRDHHGPDDVRRRLANALVNSQADRVAEITAGALLQLADAAATELREKFAALAALEEYNGESCENASHNIRAVLSGKYDPRPDAKRHGLEVTGADPA